MKTLTLTQMAEYIGLNKRTLYRMILDGRFPVEPIPRTDPRRWNKDDVDNWLNGANSEL